MAFRHRYGNVFEGPPEWRQVTRARLAATYEFEDRSTYLAPGRPISRNMPKEARFGQRRDRGRASWAIFGDSITTGPHQPGRQHQDRKPGPAST